MPRPGSGDAIIQQLQAAVAALQQAMESLQALVDGFDQDALLAKLNTAEAAVQALVARVEAVENAVPPGSLPGEVRWRSSRVQIVGVPNNGTSSRSVTASWIRSNPSAALSGVVSLCLDDEAQVPMAEGAQKTWTALSPGIHKMAAFIDGLSETTESWVVLEQ